jgi:MATE family, multidrug and toxin extrusion protein
VVVTDNLLPLFLFLYVYFITGLECWGGFSSNALKNWAPMVKLALPGLAMFMSEILAFEILTLAAAHLSTAHLAAQSLLSTVCMLAFHLPFPVSIAASTRIANLVGALQMDRARTAALVAIISAFLLGGFNFTTLLAIQSKIPRFFTSDSEVIQITASLLPVCVIMQLFDSPATICNGIIRGIGEQKFGGYINIVAYYAVAVPISLSSCFWLGWGLHGLWAGPVIALVL